MRKKAFIRVAALTLLLAAFTMPSHAKGENHTGFSDVSGDSYYADAVAWAVEAGVTNGITETTFAPKASCTRGQVVAFLWRASGKPEPETTGSFLDVSKTSFFYKPVCWAVEKQIVKGTSPTLFSPWKTCSQAHILTFLWRLAGEPESAANGQKTMAFRQHWAYHALLWAEENRLLDDAAAFSPDSPCLRADAVLYLYHYMRKDDEMGKDDERQETEAKPEPSETDAKEPFLFHAATEEEFYRLAAEMLKTYGNRIPDADEGDPYATARLIVRSEQKLPSLEEYHPLRVLENADGTYYIIQFDASLDARKCAEYLQTQEYVKYVEPDSIMYATSSDTDFAAAQQAGLGVTTPSTHSAL